MELLNKYYIIAAIIIIIIIIILKKSYENFEAGDNAVSALSYMINSMIVSGMVVGWAGTTPPDSRADGGGRVPRTWRLAPR